MGMIHPEENKQYRKMFKRFNRFMLLMWRLGWGRWINFWPEVLGQIMVLSHTGRESGRRYHTPVNYAEIDGVIYCTAGFGSGSDWVRNIAANPQVEVWLPDGWWNAVVEQADEDENRLELLRGVLLASGFAARAAGIDPEGMNDAELEEAVNDYVLLRVRRTEARTGPGGPGDLAWIWPLASFGLLLMLFVRPRRRH